MRPPLVPAALERHAFRGTEAVRAGTLTANQLRGRAWRRLYPDVYLHRDVPVTHLVRVRAATLLLPASVVTGRSAAAVWGVDLAAAEDDVEVTVPPGTHQRRVPGLVVRRAVVPDQHRWRRLGLPVTTAGATAVRLASMLPPVEAVVAVDRMIATGATDLAEVRAIAAAGRGRGCARARTACARADGLAESPPETRVRLLLEDSSLPRSVAQHTITVGGFFVARVDFAWPERKVALEYDGSWHAEPGQFAKDRRRLNRLREAGWVVVFVTAEDLRRPGALVDRVARALGAR
ncbi:Protein of unknown function [Blastococcus aggregatus]|uniref:DUF559 domain-containing protein n=1 Tax=Blastococcus aggregatus TaxID=38502 RepID=A0A285UZD3_9ACTN|nr:DUF559 domain-containing protein [Blastococcus aggregatus]SOC47202.1 Protein of unknown function [Blastococcus aggregatus]